MKKPRKIVLSCAAACVLLVSLVSCPSPNETPKSTNADLSALAISSGILIPAFAAGITTYNVTVGSAVNNITVTAAKAHSGARIELRTNGGSWTEISSGTPSPSLSMSDGSNTVELQVTAEDATTTKTYTISVYRLSAQALLSALSTSSGTLSPAFDANTASYAVSLSNAASSLTVTATTAQPGATMQVRVSSEVWQAAASGSPSPPLSLNVGDNAVEVKVTAEDGLTSNTYTVTAHRKSVDADLCGLVPSAGTLSPVFDASIASYTTNVGNAVSSITVTATASYSLSTIEAQVNGGGWQTCTSGTPSPSLSLNVGDNTVVVRVTAEDGSPQKSYNLTVRRRNGNANLSGLTIGSGTLNPAFSASTTSYTDTVSNGIGSVSVTPTAASSLSTIQVQVNGGGWQGVSSGSPSPGLSLNLGTNTVEVKVTAEDTSITKTYTIFVVRRYAGALDIDFAAGAGANNTVYSLAVQGDGKILIGGAFTTYNGTSRGCIARLNSDGSLDTSFAAGAGANGVVYSIVPQSSGKILIAGSFTSYDGTPRGRVARLNSDGSLDTSFAAGTGADGRIASIAVQSDGKIVIVGGFNAYNGTAATFIARLNSSDGSLDTTFSAWTSGPIDAVAVQQSDGKILICGGFGKCNGVSQRCIARLNSDGSLDATLVSKAAASEILSMAVQSNGKILIGGYFTAYDSTSRGRIARLNTDGSLDTTFAFGVGANEGVYSIAVQSTSVLYILVGGIFTAYDSTSRGYVSRMTYLDGSLNAGFLTVGAGANGWVKSVAVQSDGRILIGGEFTTYNGTTRGHIARLWGDD